MENNEYQGEYILDMQGICKTFPGVKALDEINLKVRKGTVHGIMGENGAGKSTMMNVLMGILRHDEGKIFFKGKEVSFKGPRDALINGISMIHQELSTVQNLTVAENIYLGREITYGKTFFNNKKEIIHKSREALHSIELDIDPSVKMKSLSVAQQQLCEIAKAISYNADLIIMDEPTSAITESEVKHLFKVIKSLKEKGVTILYITHKMAEVFEITDEISVYRDGRYINTTRSCDTNRDELIEMMVGRKITQMFPKLKADIGDEILRVEKLSRDGEFSNVSFTVRKGEILGVAGLMGAGRSEIMETIFAIRRKHSGDIYINGKKVNIKTPADAIKNGLAFITEDRKASGCFLCLSIRINSYITKLMKYSKGLFVKQKESRTDSENMRTELSIKTPSIEQKIGNLSGGNQQKVLIARWLLSDPDILIVDEPTRGIDVGSKSEIHKILSTLAQKGKAIIMISSELPEILGMSDRAMIVAEGRVTGFLNADELSQEKIMTLAHETEPALEGAII